MARVHHAIPSMLIVCALAGAQSALPPPAPAPAPAPAAAPRVTRINISRNTPKYGSVFPEVAVSRTNPRLVAVAWRRYGLPVDVNAPKSARVAECHLALSRDGGRTFTERNMMDVLRTPSGQPDLWGCNAPWVTFGNDGAIYFGGALFTAGEVPKQGRAGVTVSHDGGATWSPMVPAITLDRLAPGLKGLNGGMRPEDTPWDGANGFVDPATGVLYLTAGHDITASLNRGKAAFGTVYAGRGTTAAAFGTLIATRTVASGIPGSACPCLVAATSTDRGATWRDTVIAQAGQFNPQGTVRYPIPAASPARPGHFAVAVYQPDHRAVKLYYTGDGGQTWATAAPQPMPASLAVTSVNQAGTGYTNDGRILVTWRGFKNPGAFYTFAALFDGRAFGPTILVSPGLSIYPPLTYAGNYGNGNGAGDFTTWITGNATDAFVAFPLALEGKVEDTYLARIPLSALAPAPPRVR